MSERGLEVLDIGTGPAPALYATYDFYQALQNFANEKGYSSLVTPLPNLSSVESSLNMAHFMHRFSEISERTSGPYSPTFRDFDRLNFAELRAKERWARIEREMDEQDTSEKYAKWFVSQMFPTDHLYHYNLVILSNFLTEKSKVEGWREELLSTFLTVRHGGIAVVVGGSGEKYQPVYAIVTEVTKEALLDRVTAIVPERVPCQYTDLYALRIKEHYNTTWKWIKSNSGIDEYFLMENNISEEFWNPSKNLTGPRGFTLLVFRRNGKPWKKRR